jgi:DNA-binding PadR family transcriptional regulator
MGWFVHLILSCKVSWNYQGAGILACNPSANYLLLNLFFAFNAFKHINLQLLEIAFNHFDALYPMASKGYNDALDIIQSFQNIDASISEDALDILELFAQEESLTITDITNYIESTKIQRKYKNVYYLIEKLKSRDLIVRQRNVDKARRRRNQIYFKLTDQGIYLLFLKMRYHGILIDQLSVKKGNPPISHIDNFLKYYGDSALFKLFLYPYFEKQTIYAAHIKMLIKLFA